MAAYNRNDWSSKVSENLLIIIYRIPYYIVAFVPLMLLHRLLTDLPASRRRQGKPGFNIDYIGSLLHHSFLPAISIIIGDTALRFIMAKAMASTETSSDYMQYGQLAALPKHRIVWSYLIRTTMSPQVTVRGFVGFGFSGEPITEAVFGYPGSGSTLYNGITSVDDNLIMGITSSLSLSLPSLR